MQIEQTETGRVLVIDATARPLPALARTAKVHVWQKGDDYAVYVQQQDHPEEIPAATGWHRVGVLELEPDVDAVLDEQKQARRQQLKQEREELAKSPINNVQVGRSEDRERIQGAIDNWPLLTLVDGKKQWVMADNSVDLLSKADLEQLIPAYVQREDQCFVAYGLALSQLAAATTLEEVAAVELPYAG